jgi:hypothetical protein
MLERMRQWARMLIWIDFLITIAWYAFAVAASVATLFVVAIRGEYDRVPSLVGTVLGAAAFLAFVTWIARDARQSARAFRQERRKAKTPADGQEQY